MDLAKTYRCHKPHVSCAGLALIAVIGTACATAELDTTGIPGEGATPSNPDGGPQTTTPADASPPPELGAPDGAVPVSLPPVLSEVALTPSAGEFVEIYNPSTAAFPLAGIYLSDSPQYMLVPGALGAGPAASVGSNDFIAQFPAGASIPGQSVITVALDGPGFAATYGQPADFCVSGTGCSALVPVAMGSGATTLTNSGEPIILFSWDGASDLVADIDMVRVGKPTVGNDLQNKSGLTVDGPDPDSAPSAYPFELFSMPAQNAAPGDGQSTKRIALPLGETTMSENYATGYDQSSEDTSLTWDSLFSAPTPGSHAAM